MHVNVRCCVVNVLNFQGNRFEKKYTGKICEITYTTSEICVLYLTFCSCHVVLGVRGNLPRSDLAVRSDPR